MEQQIRVTRVAIRLRKTVVVAAAAREVLVLTLL
jgi:hypothetical protein